MVAFRNVLIIAVLALGIAFLPGGGDFAEMVLTALSMAFLAAISYAGFQLFRSQEFFLLALPESRRLVLFSAVGLVVLLIAGASMMFGSGLGTLAWLLLLGSAGIAIWLVVSEAKSY